MTTEITHIQKLESAKDFFDVTNQDNLSVVDFYTDWCGPCKRIAPVIEEFVTKYPNIKFYKINAEHPDTTLQKVVSACDITSYPSFCFFKSSKCLKKFEGANAATIEQYIKELQ